MGMSGSLETTLSILTDILRADSSNWKKTHKRSDGRMILDKTLKSCINSWLSLMLTGRMLDLKILRLSILLLKISIHSKKKAFQMNSIKLLQEG